MPQKKNITIAQFEEMTRFRKPLKPIEEIKEAVEKGEELVLEESSFSDPGPDYSAVYLGNTNVLYIPGY